MSGAGGRSRRPSPVAPDGPARSAANSDPIIVAEYQGMFPLCWLWPGEQVGSAGDGTGACIIYRADGNRASREQGLASLDSQLTEEAVEDAE